VNGENKDRKDPTDVMLWYFDCSCNYKICM